jgi:benzylsuccinate CoA-transferase BbsF subunit
MWAGPYCSLQLAELGAEVIRIESNQRPCMNRRVPPYAGDEPGLNRAGSFNQWNQAKRSVLLDMKQPDALEIAKDLIAASDVFIENYAVGVLDRLGLGWNVVSKLNPRLVMASLSGYGATGPHRERVAFGTPLTMISGLAALSGYKGKGPSEIGLSYGDPNGGLHGAFAVLAALWEREDSGLGQYIDLSQMESLVAILAEGVMPYTMRGEQPERASNRDPQMAPHGIYPCEGEDRWVSIAVRNDDEWQQLAAAIGGGLEGDARFASAEGRKLHEDELDGIVTAWTSRHDRWEITGQLQAAGIAAAPVMDMKDVAEDPHMNERGFFVQMEHPEIGQYKHAGIPWQLSATPLSVRSAAPCMGQDNEYVVCELLGRSHDEFERLLEKGVLY